MAAARAGTETPETERRLVEVVHQLLSDAASAGGSTDLTRRVLAASMTTLGAASVRLVTVDDEVLADWRQPGLAPRRREVTTMTSPLPDGSRLTVTWHGEPTVTASGLDVLASLLGMVEERTAAERHAAIRLRQQRRAWGQEIHDGITQSVTAAVMMLERVKSVGGSDPTLIPVIEEAQEEIRGALRSLRDVLAQIVEDDGESGDDGQTLAELIDDLRTRWRLQARVAVRGDLAGLDGDTAAVARAVVREALINVAKSTTAAHVTVTVNHERDLVRVQIVDDRSDPVPTPEPRLELRMLEERVARVGGTLHVDGDHGTGTAVQLVLPRARAAR